jgi:hypothetical protein
MGTIPLGKSRWLNTTRDANQQAVRYHLNYKKYAVAGKFLFDRTKLAPDSTTQILD